MLRSYLLSAVYLLALLLSVVRLGAAASCTPATCQGPTAFRFNNTACSGTPISYEAALSPVTLDTCFAVTGGSQTVLCSNPSSAGNGYVQTSTWVPSTTCTDIPYYEYTQMTGVCIVTAFGYSSLSLCSVNDTIPASTGTPPLPDSTLPAAPSVGGVACPNNDRSQCTGAMGVIYYSDSTCSGSVTSVQDLYAAWTLFTCYYDATAGPVGKNVQISTGDGVFTFSEYISGCSGVAFDHTTYYFDSEGLGPCQGGARYWGPGGDASSAAPSLMLVMIALLFVVLTSPTL